MTYESPLSKRYASATMSSLFSDQKKFSTWRSIWIALAKAEKKLGLSITHEQIEQLTQYQNKLNLDIAQAYEKELRHDVMAHVHAYGDQCPAAKPIIHLGATSCLITDNADLIIYQEAFSVIRQKLIQLINALSVQADRYKNLPCLSYTHYQPAQPTTVGKRISLWLQDFVLDLKDLDYRLQNIAFLGIKGATGTQASFLKLFNGDSTKVQKLEEYVAQDLGFKNILPLTGQTYTRKQDVHILSVLAGIATSAHKMATDFRLLAHMKELEEPFLQNQIGSSAMPYKRNPMMSERICSLSRYILSLSENPAYTAATQWFERTLDDSANRRLCIPEAFLATDGILQLLIRMSKGLVVYPSVIKKHLYAELPFMITETLLMMCPDRQEAHEIIRQHSVATGKAIKEDGKENDLLKRIADDPRLPLQQEEIEKIIAEQSLTGRAEEQVAEYLQTTIAPLLAQEQYILSQKGSTYDAPEV